MKFNRSEIFRKMHRLVKAYAMSKSEALTKAWNMTKLEILKNAKFQIDMKIQGGAYDRYNREPNNADNTLQAELLEKINELKAKIFPTVERVQKIKTITGRIHTHIDYIIDENAYNAA